MSSISRRTLLSGAAVVGVGSLLQACGNSSSEDVNNEKAEITLFHRWPAEPRSSYFVDLMKEFEKKNPNIKVKIDKVLNDTYKDKVRVSVGSPQSPDVFFSWSGSFAASLVATGNVLELDDILTKDPAFKDSFVKNQVAPFRVDGKQVGLPIDMIGKFFFYSSKIFAENGIHPPKTWDELLTTCDMLRAKGIVPISYGSKDQWTMAHYLGTLNERIVDPSVVKSDYNPKTGEFENSGYVNALEHFKTLLDYMTPSPNAVTHQQARDNWLAGKAAMMYLESGECKYIKDGFDYGTFNFPGIQGGKGDQQQLTGAPEGFMVAKNSKYLDAALALFKFLLSKPEGVDWTNRSGDLSAIHGAVEESKAPANVKAMAKNIEESSEMTPWLDNALDPQLVSTYLSETQAMIGGQKTAEQVMQSVRATAKRVRG